MIRVDPVVYTVRYYDTDIPLEGSLKDETRPYVCVSTVSIIDDEATISATMGKVSMTNFKQLVKFLQGVGIKTLKWRNANKLKIYNISK